MNACSRKTTRLLFGVTACRLRHRERRVKNPLAISENKRNVPAMLTRTWLNPSGDRTAGGGVKVIEPRRETSPRPKPERKPSPTVRMLRPDRFHALHVYRSAQDLLEPFPPVGMPLEDIDEGGMRAAWLRSRWFDESGSSVASQDCPAVVAHRPVQSGSPHEPVSPARTSRIDART